MVRCSIKRLIKIISFFILIIIIFRNFSFSSQQSYVNKFKLKPKSSTIIILSSSNSKTIQRLILFLNELRLSYIEHNTKINQQFYQDLINNSPLLIIMDYIPDKEFYRFIDQYHISLVILLNDKCKHCISINYAQMLFENISYSTIDFNREIYKPIIDTTTTPFNIIQSNEVIKILRFEKLLPYFHHHHNSQCIGLEISHDDSTSTIVYVKNKITFEKINLMIISEENKIYLSECLYNHWFIWPLFMDILRYLTSNIYDYHGLKRYIQIDIDDIFLGEKSNDYLKSNDIQALIRSQLFIQNYIKNFRYRLGFCGYYYSNSNNNEVNESNRLLIKEKDNFIWFHHTWKHEKLTNINNKISLISSTKTNLAFAQKHKLPLDSNYVVAPHHTGIYPINPIVYDVWHRIMNFNVTSTENYPYHYELPTNRRGFIYNGLSVLPRQSCGLYTTTRNYTNMSNRLEQYLMGGRLFRMILTNPISIFMSHNVNYGHDRLGNYVFSKLIYLISTWTRIQFVNDISTSELAHKYFDEYYPDEKLPLFTNPCDDDILMNLWNGNRSMCEVFPKFIIIGPQKTGTTALHNMLSQHPDLYPSKKNSLTFEELQFFSNETIYLNGITWYLNQFHTNEQSVNFEKSATYFDSILAMKRIKALLPSVRLIIMLTEPGHRAYSRYQHEIARINQTINFDDLLKSNHDENSYYFHLKQRCLQPGHYAEHILKWLKYFPSKQIYIVDGEAFRHDPRIIINDIQLSFLQLKNFINSSNLVRYNKKKGFFCSFSAKHNFQCLGNSKGRRYENMSSYSREYLNNYYLFHNQKLIKLLRYYNYSLPLWLIFSNPIKLSKRFLSLSNVVHTAEGRMGYPSERYEPTTIAAMDTDNKRLPLITGLYEDGFMIAGQDRLVGAIFSFPRQIICWNVFSPEEITPESLALLEVVQPRPEIFVLGFGTRTNKIPPETIQYIRSLKIGYEILPTTQACETFNFLLTDNRLVYGGFFPEKNLADQNYGLRKAIAHSQLYEKDEEYVKTDMLRDTYDIMLKAHRERKLLRPYSPLDARQTNQERDDESNVQSLTGTSNMEKRPPVKKENDKPIDKQS
ncbi:unnamed protein product [Adineta steineri]|uniref:[heparan sulfate]-glucosamine N-sulfotransferase n=1 Tax=Adineta steineri TaxID=433720 RepID=A0A813YAX3_9BILA|nr:unnamed protein product [Adineta steineri]